jgi:Zn-dependent protease
MAYGRSGGRLVGGVPREAFRPSAIFLGLVALFAVSGWMAWSEFGNARVDVFLLVASGWVITLCLHEYAHALFAYRAGDVAVAHRGYLTLNPLKYTHPVLSIVLPLVFVLLGGIGLPGGAVWVDHHAVRSRVWDSLISFAGPATNLLCAIVLMLPIWLGANVATHLPFWSGIAFLAFLQLTATVLNFVPIPGIDGGNIIQPWLSPKWQRGFAHVAPWGLLLLFGLLWSPAFNTVFFNAVYALGDALGLPRTLVQLGYALFRFWSF